MLRHFALIRFLADLRPLLFGEPNLSVADQLFVWFALKHSPNIPMLYPESNTYGEVSRESRFASFGARTASDLMFRKGASSAGHGSSSASPSDLPGIQFAATRSDPIFRHSRHRCTASCSIREASEALRLIRMSEITSERLVGPSESQERHSWRRIAFASPCAAR